MDMLNKWTVGLGILLVGVVLLAIGASGVLSWVQMGIGAFLAIAAVLVFVKG